MAHSSDSVRSPLETYLREINEVPLLKHADEVALARRIEEGDAEARDRMIRSNLRLVVNISRAYAGKGLGLQDLIEEENLGLLHAVERYDPDHGTRFSTYATYWIKQSIRRALTNTARTVRIPAYMIELLSKWKMKSAELSRTLGRGPTQEEIGAELGLPRKQVELVKKALRVMGKPVTGGDGEEARTLEELLPDEEPDPAEIVERSQDVAILPAMLQKVDPREAMVLRLRFGLDAEEPLTLKAIAQRLGISRERVRQIESEALDRIRQNEGLESA